MTKQSASLPVPLVDAYHWARDSLDQGWALSQQLETRLEYFVFAYVLAVSPPAESEAIVLDSNSRSVRGRDANAEADRIVNALVAGGAGTLLVEDDCGMRGEPRLGEYGPYGFVEDHVVRWQDLTRTDENPSQLLRDGATGYPLNAVVCVPQPADLHLTPGEPLSIGQQASIVSSACAVILGVHDAETFVILLTAEAATWLHSLVASD